MSHATGLRVALLGFGNVGRAFARFLSKREGACPAPVRIVAVTDSSALLPLREPDSLGRVLGFKEAGGCLADLDGSRLVHDATSLLASLRNEGAGLVVESLPSNIRDGEPALGWLIRLLGNGINVVTVDKGPLAHGFEALELAALRGDSRILFSGATGVGMPGEVRQGATVAIEGVLNGTSNYVLTSMLEKGDTFQDALDRARAEGIAEPDPALDIEGWDTACKVLILAKATMTSRASLREVVRTGLGPGIESLVGQARERGRVVRLLGRAVALQQGTRLNVGPEVIGPESPFFHVTGTAKAALFRMKDGRELLVPAASGREAIARTIFEDVLVLCRAAG